MLELRWEEGLLDGSGSMTSLSAVSFLDSMGLGENIVCDLSQPKFPSAMASSFSLKSGA